MKLFFFVFNLWAACILPAFAEASETLTNKIWDVSTSQFVSFQNMLQSLSTKPYILLGERHGRKAHQNREAFFIGALAEAGRYPTVAFEMLDHTQTVIVEQYRQNAPEYALGLAQPLKWADSNWPSWSFYQPVFDTAFMTKARIVGADLTDQEQENVQPNNPENTSSESLSYYKQHMAKAHCNLIEEPRAIHLAHLQIARDQNMAKTLVDQKDPDHGIILIVGSAHIRHTTGIPIYLPPNETTVVALIETQNKTSEFLKKDQSIVTGDIKDFDFIWFTPKINKPSLCDRIDQNIKK